jgi:hypothetical protein
MDEGEEQIALPHDFMQADVDHIVLLIGANQFYLPPGFNPHPFHPRSGHARKIDSP